VSRAAAVVPGKPSTGWKSGACVGGGGQAVARRGAKSANQGDGVERDSSVGPPGPSAGTEGVASSAAGAAAFGAGTATSSANLTTTQKAVLETPKEQTNAVDRPILDYLRGATLNFALDEYYSFNFNNPVGRVNAFRAYDVLSNNISLNQADVVFERAPDVSARSESKETTPRIK
jgi:hypothetical protein